VRRLRQHVQEQGVRHEPPADPHGQKDRELFTLRLHVLHQTAARRAPDETRQAVHVRHLQQEIRAEISAGRAQERGPLQSASVQLRAVQQVVQDQGVARRPHDRPHGHP